MKLGNQTRLTREGLPGLPEGEAFDLLIDHINKTNEEKTQALQQNITIADNMNAAYITQRMTHGVERTIKNPLKGRPTGITVHRSSAIDGGVRYGVANIDWRFIDGTDPTQPQQLGITVYYAPPNGRVDVRRDAVQSVAAGTAPAIGWDTTVTAATGSLSITGASSERVSCAVAGEVLITAQAIFDTSAATLKEIYFLKNADFNNRWGLSWATVTGYFGASPSAQIPVAAGDYIELRVGHGLGVAVNVLGGSTLGPRLQARYVAPPATAKNDVTFVVHGG